MNSEQIYNPVVGINRMIADIESVFEKVVFKLHPLLRVMSIANLYIVIAVFVALLAYMIFVRKHTVMNKLRRPTNYFAAAVLLVIYAFLTEAPLRLGPGLNLNFGLVVMPMAAKLFGPILSCVFGMIQYGTSFIMHVGEEFNFASVLVAGISGMLYGWIIYGRRAKYLRCLAAKLIVNVVCNIVLVPLVTGEILTSEMAGAVARTMASNIFFAPVQALAIYIALLIMKKVRRLMGEVSWDFGRK